MCKRIVAFMLVGVLSISCLVGCGQDTEAVSNSVDTNNEVIENDNKVKDKKFIAALDAYQEYFDTVIKSDYNGDCLANIVLDADGMPVMIASGAIGESGLGDITLYTYTDNKVKLLKQLGWIDEIPIKACTDGLICIANADSSDDMDWQYYRLKGDELTELCSLGYGKSYDENDDSSERVDDSIIIIDINNQTYTIDHNNRDNEYEEMIQKVYQEVYGTTKGLNKSIIRCGIEGSMYEVIGLLRSPVTMAQDDESFLPPAQFRLKVDKMKEAGAMTHDEYLTWNLNFYVEIGIQEYAPLDIWTITNRNPLLVNDINFEAIFGGSQWESEKELVTEILLGYIANTENVDLLDKINFDFDLSGRTCQGIMEIDESISGSTVKELIESYINYTKNEEKRLEAQKVEAKADLIAKIKEIEDADYLYTLLDFDNDGIYELGSRYLDNSMEEVRYKYEDSGYELYDLSSEERGGFSWDYDMERNVFFYTSSEILAFLENKTPLPEAPEWLGAYETLWKEEREAEARFMSFLYVNDDDIPEMYVNNASGRAKIFSYDGNEVSEIWNYEATPDEVTLTEYAPKKGVVVFYTRGGLGYSPYFYYCVDIQKGDTLGEAYVYGDRDVDGNWFEGVKANEGAEEDLEVEVSFVDGNPDFHIADMIDGYEREDFEKLGLIGYSVPSTYSMFRVKK